MTDKKGNAAEGVQPPNTESDDEHPLGSLRSLLPDAATITITDDHVQSVLNVRRARERLFGKSLFSDPAWDVILELYGAMLANRRMSASHLSLAIGTPRSVIERWLNALARSGLVTFEPGEGGASEPVVRLTAEGSSKLAQLVDHWGSAFVAI